MSAKNELSTVPTSPSFYDAIEKLRKCPPMYLGNRSLQNFAHWLHGYQCARHDFGIPSSEEEKEFSEFHAFVGKKTRMGNNAGWWKNILYFYEDDGSALEQFFTLFDEFREMKPKQKARRTKKSKIATNVVEEAERE